MKDKIDSSHIPESWVGILFEDSIDNISTVGRKEKQKEYLETGSFPVVDQGKSFIGGYTNDETKVIDDQLPLIVFGDHTKIVKFVNLPFVAGADGVKVLHPLPFYNSKLFFYFTSHLAKQIEDRGYSRHFQFLTKSEILLPPFNEQNRIVNKIEEIFSELDKGVENLTTAREQLKVYRQALLRHAFEGKLTEAWRKKRADQLETADQLLDRTKQERDEHFQKQLEEWGKTVELWEEDGKEGKKPTKPRRPPKISEFSDSIANELPPIPKEWKWIPLTQAAENIQIGPFGSLLHKSDYISGGTPVINPSHIKNGRILPDNNLTISEEKLATLLAFKMRQKDIVIGRRGEMGRCAVVTKNEDGFLCGTGSLYVRLLSNINADFLCFVLSSQRVKDHLSNQSIGTTMQNLNQKILHQTPVPLVSLSEQEVILNIIKNSEVEIDQLIASIDQALIQAIAMRKSILKKAFSGQLVPQNSDDEPASELLARIQTEREQAQKETKRSKVPRKIVKKKKVNVMADLMEVLKNTKDWLNAQEVFRQCGIADGSETDDIEKIYEELRTYEKEDKIDIERRGDEDWLRVAQEG